MSGLEGWLDRACQGHLNSLPGRSESNNKDSEVEASQARLVMTPGEARNSCEKGFWERCLVPHVTVCPSQGKREH